MEELSQMCLRPSCLRRCELPKRGTIDRRQKQRTTGQWLKNKKRFGVGVGVEAEEVSLEVLHLVVRRERSQGQDAGSGQGYWWRQTMEAYLLRV